MGKLTACPFCGGGRIVSADEEVVHFPPEPVCEHLIFADYEEAYRREWERHWTSSSDAWFHPRLEEARDDIDEILGPGTVKYGEVAGEPPLEDDDEIPPLALVGFDDDPETQKGGQTMDKYRALYAQSPDAFIGWVLEYVRTPTKEGRKALREALYARLADNNGEETGAARY